MSVKKLIVLLILFVLNDLLLVWILKPITQVVTEPVTDTGWVLVDTGAEPIHLKEYLVCKDVCSGNDDLVQYARELTKDRDFILTIIQESHRNPFSVSVRGEHGLLQRTKDTLPKKEFIESQEFQNPYRQVDRAWEDRQRRIPYPEVINRQLAGYKDRMKRDKYLHIENK